MHIKIDLDLDDTEVQLIGDKLVGRILRKLDARLDADGYTEGDTGTVEHGNSCATYEVTA